MEYVIGVMMFAFIGCMIFATFYLTKDNPKKK